MAAVARVNQDSDLDILIQKIQLTMGESRVPLLPLRAKNRAANFLTCKKEGFATIEAGA